MECLQKYGVIQKVHGIIFVNIIYIYFIKLIDNQIMEKNFKNFFKVKKLRLKYDFKWVYFQKIYKMLQKILDLCLYIFMNHNIMKLYNLYLIAKIW